MHLLAKRKREEHTSSVHCLGELFHFVVGNKRMILNCLFLQSKAIEDEKQREILEERERAAKALLEITG